jgi:hypothetical protein
MKFIEDFKNEGLRVRLTMQEKATLRARLSERMMLNPASPVLRSPYHFFVFNRAVLQRTFAAVVFFVFVLGSGGTSYAAQGALPGDVLYAIKIHVNELVETKLATTQVAKAEVQAVLAERRVEEAQTLASRGMLTEVAATELQIRFDEHATAAQSLTKELAAIDPGAAAQIGTQFSSSLAANDAVLVSLGEQSQNEETKNTARVLSERVRAQKDAIARANVQVLEDADVVPRPTIAVRARALSTAKMTSTALVATSTVASTTVDAIEEQTDSPVAPVPVRAKETLRQSIADELKARTVIETGTLVEQLRAQELSADAKEKVQAELDAVAVLMSAGNAALGAADYDSAISKFGRALQKTVALQAYVRAGRDFKSDIVPLLHESLRTDAVDND